MATQGGFELFGIFVYPERKISGFDDLPLQSARDVKKWFVFKLSKEMTEEKFFDKMQNRHRIRQRDIHN